MHYLRSSNADLTWTNFHFDETQKSFPGAFLSLSLYDILWRDPGCYVSAWTDKSKLLWISPRLWLPACRLCLCFICRLQGLLILECFFLSIKGWLISLSLKGLAQPLNFLFFFLFLYFPFGTLAVYCKSHSSFSPLSSHHSKWFDRPIIPHPTNADR